MKRIKIFLLFILVTLIVFFATFLQEGNPDNKRAEQVSVKVYYVPVTNYFSDLADYDPGEMQERSIYLSDEDKGLLAERLGGINLIDYPETGLPAGQLGIVRWDKVTPDLKTLSYKGKYLWNKDEVGQYDLFADEKLTEAEADELIYRPELLTKINFLGDIMLSRHVNTQMSRFGYDYPWLKVRDQVADADITFANLEVPISDRYRVPAQGMSFVASTKNLEYLKEAGIDVVSVANNHTANFGRQAFLDSLNNLKESGIKVCGGGLTEAEARTAATIKTLGASFNFLCQSAITGSMYADGDESGVPFLGIEPWYRRNQSSLDSLVRDIRNSPQGVTITSPHWGVEYKQYPNADQREVAKLMIDNGVDLIMGTHPHVVQSSEYYRDRYISYSLGNFIFDQEWSTETKQGVMASAYFYGDKNMAVNLVPLQIENYAQPSFVGGATKAKILNDIKSNTLGLY